jgi:hypothetical protein
MVKIWTDRISPLDTRVWTEIYADPIAGPALVRRECYTLSPCWLHTRVNQVYYIRGDVLTDTGCTRWNVDDP